MVSRRNVNRIKAGVAIGLGAAGLGAAAYGAHQMYKKTKRPMDPGRISKEKEMYERRRKVYDHMNPNSTKSYDEWTKTKKPKVVYNLKPRKAGIINSDNARRFAQQSYDSTYGTGFTARE